MNNLLVLLIISQPVLPELPTPPQLEPPTKRPVTIPFENDTLSLGITIGIPLGFEAIARHDGSMISGRSLVSFCERQDHFRGLQSLGYFDVSGTFKAFQVSAGVDARKYSNATIVTHEESTSQHSYASASLLGLWHLEKFLSTLGFKAYSSTMAGHDRMGGEVSPKLFFDNSWGRFLSKTQARIDPEGTQFITEAISQHQVGFMLLTPRLQASFAPQRINIFGFGAGANLLALIKNLSLELDGYYHNQTPIVLDMMLLEPVQASLNEDAQSYTIEDNISFGVGYRGVEFGIFARKGEGLFWQQDFTSMLPELSTVEFSQAGGEVGMKLESRYISNSGRVKFFFSNPQTPWTAPWELKDSLSINIKSWGVFFLVDAVGERHYFQERESSYALLGCGLVYEREPFRILLRADDLFDRRPQLWPGLRDSGRRIGLSVALFSTDW